MMQFSGEIVQTDPACTYSVYLIPGSFKFCSLVVRFFQAEKAKVIPESPKSSPLVNYEVRS